MTDMDDKFFEMNQYLKALSKATVEELGLLKRIAEGTNAGARSGGQTHKETVLIKKAGHKDSENLSEAQQDLEKIGETSKKSLNVQKAQSKILASMKVNFGQQLDIDKRARARGTTLSARLTANSSTVDKLTNGITGFQNAQKITFSLFDAGFRENNFELAKLTTATYLTGQNHRDMIRNLRSVVAGSTINNKELSHLAKVTLSLQERFGVTGEELTSAMAKLKESFERYDVLGITAAGDEAGKMLAAILGQEFASEGGKLLGKLTSAEGYAQAVMLGVTDERRRFLAGDAKAGVDLVLNASRAAVRKRDQFLTQGGEKGIQLGNFMKRFEEAGVLGVRVQNQANRRATQEGTSVGGLRAKAFQEPYDPGKEWSKTFDNFIDKSSSVFTDPMSKITEVLPEVFGSGFAVKIFQVGVALLGLKLAVNGLRFLKAFPSHMRDLGISLDGLKRAVRVQGGRSLGGSRSSGFRSPPMNLRNAKFTQHFPSRRAPYLPQSQVPFRSSLEGMRYAKTVKGLPHGKGGNLISGFNPILGPKNLKSGTKMGGKMAAKTLGKKIPFGIGALIALGFAGNRLLEGDIAGAGLELASGGASILPGPGTAASFGIDAYIMKRDLDREQMLNTNNQLSHSQATDAGSPQSRSVMEATLNRMNANLEEMKTATYQGNSQRNEIVNNSSPRPHPT